MPSLTRYLQNEFAELCPPGWHCRHEAYLLEDKLNRLLGYSARADVLFERDDGGRRLWIEFEVSRADPVANHAKFATAHLFRPQPQTDSFVAMVSSHVAPGRRNLSAHAVQLMRRVGMSAFQTSLLPHLHPAEIKRLNQLPSDALGDESIDVAGELERAMTVCEPISPDCEHQIHFAPNQLTVFTNVRTWNEQVATEEGRQLWGCRRVQYFAYDPFSSQFAPCKFCAYATAVPTYQHPMSMEFYANLGQSESRFDGTRAHKHLARRLKMQQLSADSDETLSKKFHDWLELHENSTVRVRQNQPKLLVPLDWWH